MQYRIDFCNEKIVLLNCQQRTINHQNSQTMSNTTLTPVQKILFNAEVKFYIEQGFSQADAEAKGWEKLEKIAKLKNVKGIVRK